MKIRIETSITPAALKEYLEARSLSVPVFFDKDTNIVITVNRRSRIAALELIQWLVMR